MNRRTFAGFGLAAVGGIFVPQFGRWFQRTQEKSTTYLDYHVQFSGGPWCRHTYIQRDGVWCPMNADTPPKPTIFMEPPTRDKPYYWPRANVSALTKGQCIHVAGIYQSKAP